MRNELKLPDERFDIAIDEFAAGSFREERAVFTFLRTERDMDVETGNFRRRQVWHEGIVSIRPLMNNEIENPFAKSR